MLSLQLVVNLIADKEIVSLSICTFTKAIQTMLELIMLMKLNADEETRNWLR